MQTIKLLSRRKAAPTLFVLEFERPADYSFRAGQFARLGTVSYTHLTLPTT